MDPVKFGTGSHTDNSKLGSESYHAPLSGGSSKPPKRLRVEPPDLDTLIEDSQQDAAVREVRQHCYLFKLWVQIHAQCYRSVDRPPIA